MTLNEQQFELINFVEQEYLLHGSIPSAARIKELELASEKYYTDLLANSDFRNNLLARGIRFGGDSGGDAKLSYLTEEQLTAANTILDLTDNRSKKKKLIDLGISTQKWEAWLRDAAFQKYLRERAENILGDNVHEAHLALLDRVQSGDTNAIKFYYEITGRYVQRSDNNVDLPALLMRILEIIQRHVTNDQEIMAISEDLLTLANGASITRAVDIKVLDAI